MPCSGSYAESLLASIKDFLFQDVDGGLPKLHDDMLWLTVVHMVGQSTRSRLSPILGWANLP